MKSDNLQEEVAPYRGRCAAGVVARASCRACRDIESPPVPVLWGRGRISAFEPRSPRGTPSMNDGAGVEGCPLKGMLRDLRVCLS
jgi:hypothetical protein